MPVKTPDETPAEVAAEQGPPDRPLPVLAPELLLACYADAARCYPREACGLILGPAGGPCDEVRACENQQDRLHAADPETYPRDATTAYNLAARDVLALERSLSGPRPARVIYHSHVEVGAYFSAEDVRAATYEGEPLYPVDYLVVDAAAAGARGAALFRFRGGAFVEVARFDASGRGPGQGTAPGDRETVPRS